MNTDTAPHPFDGIPSSLDTSEADALYNAYRAMRDGTLPVVALAPSDASSSRPHFSREGACEAGPETGSVWCARCDDRGHRTLTHRRALQTCHDDGWKAATVAAVRANTDDVTADRAQAWLSRWSPADRLTVGCPVCNGEDGDWGSAPMPRQCGVDCC